MVFGARQGSGCCREIKSLASASETTRLFNEIIPRFFLERVSRETVFGGASSEENFYNLQAPDSIFYLRFDFKEIQALDK